ncbi:hypothetical protein HPB50_002110 [Hyalomma asiaticum]|uniref:Uncharacterized protein n=1 Tax=Hyalomma asiaticum TaxID=266040 RepID=A0ACB7RHS9_HYAAI|nr:hypothetical protein HPB50_002110 [Hyalomma asiaticum]
MAFWEYTLTGFGDFFEQRRVAFVEPIPADRVCSTCGRIPGEAVLLPCGHLSCLQCKGEVCEAKRCPFDGEAVTEEKFVLVRTDESFLEKRSVVCVVGGRKCASFVGKLSNLRDHLYHCRSGDVHCVKCYRPVAREAAVEHYSQCCELNNTSPSVNDESRQKAVQEVRGIKEDLEKLRQLALGEREGDDDDLVNGANGLVERLATLHHSMTVAQEQASGIRQGANALPSSKSPVLGPFRPASKAGVYVTTCEFKDVYDTRAFCVQNNKNYVMTTGDHRLSGYTFRLRLLFRPSGDGSGLSVYFGMYLMAGEWDDFVEWPFSKKVPVIIVHPRDATKDIMLTLRFDATQVVMKPRPGGTNHECTTKKQSWSDIELGGYIIKDTLYVNVEFE